MYINNRNAGDRQTLFPTANLHRCKWLYIHYFLNNCFNSNINKPEQETNYATEINNMKRG